MRATIKELHIFCYQIIDLRLAAHAQGDAKGAVDSKAGKVRRFRRTRWTSEAECISSRLISFFCSGSPRAVHGHGSQS